MAQPTSPDAPTAGVPAVPDPSAPSPAPETSATQTGVTLEKPRHFCRYGGIVGSRRNQWDARTAGLLHGRLKALSLVISVAWVVFQARELFLPAGLELNASRAAMVPLLAIAAYLWWEKDPPLIKLRVFEVLVFVLPIVSMVIVDRHLILQAALAGDPEAAVTGWHRLLIHMVLVIFGYAMFIPAGWKRTLVSTMPMAVVPFAVGGIIMANVPEVAAAARQALNTEEWTAGLIVMVLAVAMATYGTYTIDQHRHQLADMGFAGQYTLEKKIGTGGMGEVWRARHHLLSRPAAIKVIRPEVLRDGDDDVSVMTAMKRFEREAQATASLTSPHTIDLYDFGTTMDGSFYYVMQFLDGMNLDELVETHGPVPVERAVHLITQAAASLADAHDHGLIHRDIKPANIFATRMGITHDFVKVLDFGLVKETKNDMQATQLTQQGMTSGTPAFMPPEIALAKDDVDGRADVYALACVAYWLVTGQYVFEADSPMAMVVDHVKSEPPAPSSRTELSIPREFDQAILRALAKDPSVRPASMREFAEELRRVPVAEPWTDRRAEEWWSLRPTATSTSAAMPAEAAARAPGAPPGGGGERIEPGGDEAAVH